MPKHYAVGVNSQSGRVAFNNTKTMDVTFEKEFVTVPSVMLTLSDSGSAPAYKTSETKTGFKIKFKATYNGHVEWRATE